MPRPQRSHGHDAALFIHASADHDSCDAFYPDIPLRAVTAPKLPELALLIAVLEQAADDLHRDDVKLARDAHDWIADDSRSDEFSFRGACAVLGLNAERVRKKLCASLDTKSNSGVHAKVG